MNNPNNIFTAKTKDEIKNSLKTGSDINSYISGTPLIIACINNDYELVKNLITTLASEGCHDNHAGVIVIEMGANIEIKVPVFILNDGYIEFENTNINALQLMVELENKNMVKILLEQGADPNSLFFDDEFEGSILSRAINTGKLGIVEILVEHNAVFTDIEELAFSMTTIIGSENLDMLDFILSIYPDVNVANMEQITPLLVAIDKKRIDIIDRLLISGANVNCEVRNLSKVKCFNSGGERVSVKNFSTLPIYNALKTGNFDVCKRILDMGVNLDLDIYNYSR